jgi:Cu(I)/Ag(I) efflux system membrane protein CusA/SilA
MKIQGPTLEGIQQAGAQIQQALSSLPDTRSIFAERVSQGFYINIEVNRAEAARYGLTVADVQQAVSSGIGGQMVTENIEGREATSSIGICAPDGVAIRTRRRKGFNIIPKVAVVTDIDGIAPRISFSRGPAMIRDEDGALTGYVYIDLNTKDYGDFVNRADSALRQKLTLPAGYTYSLPGNIRELQNLIERAEPPACVSKKWAPR